MFSSVSRSSNVSKGRALSVFLPYRVAKNIKQSLLKYWARSSMFLVSSLYFISYHEQENDKKNVARKIDNLNIKLLNIKLDLLRGCKLSLFGKCLVVKTLGISQIVYSASMLDFSPNDYPELRSLFLVLFGTRNQIRSKEILCVKTIQMGDCGRLTKTFCLNLCG